VFPNIVVLTVLLVEVAHSFEASVRHILLILAPANAFVFKEVDYGGNVGGNFGECVMAKDGINTDTLAVVLYYLLNAKIITAY
jgi:hypothetical protein